MRVVLLARNESARKGLYRLDNLRCIAGKVSRGEGAERDVEISLLFCDDERIRDLNRTYRHTNQPTDVLSFAGVSEGVPGQESVLGDIVISLETVARRCTGDPVAQRAEVRLLFCHGLLHLLGYDHDTAAERKEMAAKQAHYLGVAPENAWLDDDGLRKRQDRPGKAPHFK